MPLQIIVLSVVTVIVADGWGSPGNVVGKKHFLDNWTGGDDDQEYLAATKTDARVGSVVKYHFRTMRHIGQMRSESKSELFIEW